MTLRTALKTLLTLALALPVAYCALIWVRGLLLSMGDPGGAAVIGYVGAGCLAGWSLCLVGLVILLAIIVALDGADGDNNDTSA